MFWSAQDMGVQALLLYLTVSSGYLVVAYIVGNELTRSQALFVSGLFLVFALYALWGVGQYWSIGDEARIALEGLGADTIGLNYLRLNPAVIAFPMGLLGIFGSLKFMWDIRQRRTD
jgi:TRAP-type C4-dicarboxylate transport system permease small subunit